MIQRILLISIIVILIFIGLGLILVAPYHIYTLSLTDGVQTRFLSFTAPTKEILNGEDFVLNDTDQIKYEDASVWKEFHFQHFILNLPVHHPNYAFLPKLQFDQNETKLGGEFIDTRDVKLASFTTSSTQKFELQTGKEKLFLLPIFKKMIDNKDANEKWKDLFSKRLQLPSNEGKGFLNSLISAWSMSYKDLVYNLYILYNRKIFFQDEGNSIKEINFDRERRIGRVVYKNSDNITLDEKFYFFEDGIVYRFGLKSFRDRAQSRNLRFKIINKLKVRHSNPDSSISIYAEYKGLTYTQRVDAEGMTFLMAAWSHDLANKEYLRVIINFLERGVQNIKFLKPLYEYAYRKYGTSLSSRDELIIETPDEKVKRKAKEELEKEIQAAENERAAKQDGSYSSDEEKIRKFLQKAKDEKVNSDKNSKVLSSP